jgi:pyruvate/2-oxoglutarate dehydrogenase complex dihydrolipoamide acyltransferase (E2) component
MATEIRLPDVGEGVADVTINRWRVNTGDAVSAGDVILEVATDKVDTEIQAPASGVLLKINFRAGELAPVTAVMGYIGQAGEENADVTSAAPVAPGASAGALAPGAESVGVKATPVARRVAADKGVDLTGVAGTGHGGQITKQDVLTHSAAPASTPAALPGDLADAPTLAVRRVAADYNINLREIADDRPLSTLTKYDVLSAVASRVAGQAGACRAGIWAKSEGRGARGRSRGEHSRTTPLHRRPAPFRSAPAPAAPKPDRRDCRAGAAQAR